MSGSESSLDRPWRFPTRSGQACRHGDITGCFSRLSLHGRLSGGPWPAAAQGSASTIMFALQRTTRVALDAIQLLGGNGYISYYATVRLLRDAQLHEID